MKTLKGIYFLLAVVLAFGLFAGCDNGTTSDNDDEFVLIPVDPIAPPYTNIPTLDNYDAIFVGENHYSRERYDVYLNLMKYYYSLGVRDFAGEQMGHGHALLLQYYFDTGDEECLQFILRDTRGYTVDAVERPKFYRDIYAWNASLPQKIKFYNFDVGHSFNASTAALYLYILKKYPLIEGIPGLSAPGSKQELIDDFRNNKARYSRLNAADMKLFDKIITNLEQYNAWGGPGPNDALRENYMIGNFREILNDTGGRKIFAWMGWNHASLNGNANPPQTRDFSMASVLKNEIRIASIVLRQQPDPDRFQYIVMINENLQSEPYNSAYNGNWPFPNGSGYSGHLPSITRFVAGITLADSNNGLPEKTVFKVGDQFYYGFQARDSKGDWKRMVHNVTYGNSKYDWSWDFPNDFIGSQGIGTNSGGYRLEAGIYEMEWYIVDAADNKSNVITRTITVNP